MAKVVTGHDSDRILIDHLLQISLGTVNVREYVCLIFFHKLEKNAEGLVLYTGSSSYCV
jgi:hypothetical protein